MKRITTLIIILVLNCSTNAWFGNFGNPEKEKKLKGYTAGNLCYALDQVDLFIEFAQLNQEDADSVNMRNYLICDYNDPSLHKEDSFARILYNKNETTVTRQRYSRYLKTYKIHGKLADVLCQKMENLLELQREYVSTNRYELEHVISYYIDEDGGPRKSKNVFGLSQAIFIADGTISCGIENGKKAIHIDIK